MTSRRGGEESQRGKGKVELTFSIDLTGLPVEPFLRNRSSLLGRLDGDNRSILVGFESRSESGRAVGGLQFVVGEEGQVRGRRFRTESKKVSFSGRESAVVQQLYVFRCVNSPAACPFPGESTSTSPFAPASLKLFTPFPTATRIGSSPSPFPTTTVA